MKKKLIIFLVIIMIVVGIDSCRDKRADKPQEDIYRAKDYALEVFQETMPEDYTVVKAKGSTGDDKDDSVYEITFTYTIGEEDEKYSYRYVVSVGEESFEILEEGPAE